MTVRVLTVEVVAKKKKTYPEIGFRAMSFQLTVSNPILGGRRVKAGVPVVLRQNVDC